MPTHKLRHGASSSPRRANAAGSACRPRKAGPEGLWSTVTAHHAVCSSIGRVTMPLLLAEQADVRWTSQMQRHQAGCRCVSSASTFRSSGDPNCGAADPEQQKQAEKGTKKNTFEKNARDLEVGRCGPQSFCLLAVEVGGVGAMRPGNTGSIPVACVSYLANAVLPSRLCRCAKLGQARNVAAHSRAHSQ